MKKFRDEVDSAAYWQARNESFESCLRRLEAWLARIATVINGDPIGWTADVRATQTVPAADLAGVLRAGRNHSDVTGAAIRELGYSASFHLRATSVSAVARVTCGVSTPLVPNVALVSIIDQSRGVEELVALARQMLNSTWLIWHPTWGRVTTNEVLRATIGTGNQPKPGVVTYLDREWLSMWEASHEGTRTRERQDGSAVIELTDTSANGWPAMVRDLLLVPPFRALT